MTDVHKLLHGEKLGRHNHPNGLILRNNTWHTSEHSLGRASEKTINSHMTTKSLRSGTLYFVEERLGFSHKELVTHSIWSGFAMELYLAKVYPKKSWSWDDWQAAPTCGIYTSSSLTSERASVTLWQKITLSIQYQKYKLSTTHQDTTTQTQKGWS